MYEGAIIAEAILDNSVPSMYIFVSRPPSDGSEMPALSSSLCRREAIIAVDVFPNFVKDAKTIDTMQLNYMNEI